MVAETLTFKCQEKDAGVPAEMTLTYQGDASGTLRVQASFGEMSLRATKEAREGVVDGAKLKVLGIRASGAASVLMPARTELERCIAAKTKLEEAGDQDIFTLHLLACRTTVPLGGAPVPITASVEIAVVEPPQAVVYVKRTYPEKSAVPGGQIVIELIPPPACELDGPR